MDIHGIDPNNASLGDMLVLAVAVLWRLFYTLGIPVLVGLGMFLLAYRASTRDQRPARTSACDDCGRVFDFDDQIDVCDWAFGHDCPTPSTPRCASCDGTGVYSVPIGPSRRYVGPCVCNPIP